ncbi:MAG TPA: UvrB/UvrC motif-containing protein [Phycisphaerales bacterium]|nr:UvrB/UvrC motif-containing protein [Phycisphaerales bacterium]
MKRQCDRCEREATVHEMVIRHGKQVEKHLCERCAREEGIAIPAAPSIQDVVKQFVVGQAAAAAAASGAAPATPATQTKSPTCASCGLTFAEFRQSGLLGCPECYKTFEAQIGPLLERAHEGGTHHTGKVPTRGGTAPDPHQRIAKLRKELLDAVAAEQYERAARLRDQLLHTEPGAGEAERAREPNG